MTAGGLVVRLAVGYAASFVHRHLDDHLIEITLSTIVAFGSFLLGQQLGMSGVVACVTAGIVVGNYGRHRNMGPVTRVTMGTVWEYAAFVANSLIFLLIGLRMDLGTIADNAGLVIIGFVGRALVGRAVDLRLRPGARGSPGGACRSAGSTCSCGAACAALSPLLSCSASRPRSAGARR